MTDQALKPDLSIVDCQIPECEPENVAHLPSLDNGVTVLQPSRTYVPAESRLCGHLRH